MNFWKKLFAGMGFVCGFLVFETMSLAYRNSSRRHKNRKGRCRRNSSWDTLTRYMIFAWIYDGVKKSREQVGRRYYRRTGSEFRPSCDSDTRSNPFEPAKAALKTTDAAQPKKQRSPPSAPKTTAKTASASTADRLKVPAAEAKPPRETTVKPAPAAEKFLPDAVPDTENLPVPEPKTPQEVEAERQQKLARLRTELREQVCAIHADVTLPPDREQGSEATEQQLHILLYQTDVPEAERQQMLARLRTELREQVCAIHADVTLPPDREQGSEAAEQQLHILLYQTDVPESELNAALSDLRTQRRREKAQYQGAPFADVFQVELILSEEDSDRACIVDVGDTGRSYVIPWSSIPQELQQPLRRYVAQADGKLCGYCKEDLCNTENGRMIVELYLGKQEHHVSRIVY